MSESSLNKGGHGAMYVDATRRDAAAEALTLLDAGTVILFIIPI